MGMVEGENGGMGGAPDRAGTSFVVTRRINTLDRARDRTLLGWAGYSEYLNEYKIGNFSSFFFDVERGRRVTKLTLGDDSAFFVAYTKTVSGDKNDLVSGMTVDVSGCKISAEFSSESSSLEVATRNSAFSVNVGNDGIGCTITVFEQNGSITTAAYSTITVNIWHVVYAAIAAYSCGGYGIYGIAALG